MKIPKILIISMLISIVAGCKKTEQIKEVKPNNDVNMLLNKEYTFTDKKYLYLSSKISDNENVESCNKLIELYSLERVKFDLVGNLSGKKYLGTSVEDGYQNQFDVCDNINDRIIEGLSEKIKKNPSLDYLVSILGQPEINSLAMEDYFSALHVWSIANVNDSKLYQILAATSDGGKIEFCLVIK